MSIDEDKVIGFELRGAKKILNMIEEGKITDKNIFKKRNKYQNNDSIKEEHCDNLFDKMKEFGEKDSE